MEGTCVRIGICDDERNIRELLAARVRRVCPEAELALFSDGEELLDGADRAGAAGDSPRGQSPSGCDIVILDIQMPGRDGMAVARALRERDERLVILFVTAVEEYVFQAFDVSALHYLVKPFSEEQFDSVLRRAIEQAERQKRMEAPSGKAEKGQLPARFLMIKTGGRSIRVETGEIVYAEVLNRKITLHLTEESAGDAQSGGREQDIGRSDRGAQNTLVYYGKMAELESELGEDFYRVHRAYLVNLRYVRSYDAGEVRMEGARCIMAKAKYQGFVKAFLRYIARQEG